MAADPRGERTRSLLGCDLLLRRGDLIILLSWFPCPPRSRESFLDISTPEVLRETDGPSPLDGTPEKVCALNKLMAIHSQTGIGLA